MLHLYHLHSDLEQLIVCDSVPAVEHCRCVAASTHQGLSRSFDPRWSNELLFGGLQKNFTFLVFDSLPLMFW